MSEYVEARYALLILQAARDASPERAEMLLDDLLKDLRSRQHDRADYGANAVTAIRQLATILHEHKTPPAAYWDTADRAALAWCDHADQ